LLQLCVAVDYEMQQLCEHWAWPWDCTYYVNCCSSVLQATTDSNVSMYMEHDPEMKILR